ncbi:MAG: OB-fold domain-containing protein [Spongiibacteraceae bacterium]
MSEAAKRKLPILEPETAFFWTSGQSGKLHIQRCGDCGHWQHPPLPCCPVCHQQNVTPQPVSGRGRVATFTINYESWLPNMTVPFVFAAIELDEQPELYVFSNVLCATDKVNIGDEIKIGMRVQVYFEQHDDIYLPLFQPEGLSQPWNLNHG